MGWKVDNEQLREALTDYAKEANCYKDNETESEVQE